MKYKVVSSECWLHAFVIWDRDWERKFIWFSQFMTDPCPCSLPAVPMHTFRLSYLKDISQISWKMFSLFCLDFWALKPLNTVKPETLRCTKLNFAQSFMLQIWWIPTLKLCNSHKFLAIKLLFWAMDKTVMLQKLLVCMSNTDRSL